MSAEDGALDGLEAAYRRLVAQHRKLLGEADRLHARVVGLEADLVRDRAALAGLRTHPVWRAYVGLRSKLVPGGSRRETAYARARRWLRARRTGPRMRVVAILGTYNEERFIEVCTENLVRQGAEVFLIDNESTDRTVALARRALGPALLGVETMPRTGVFSMRRLLEWKERLAARLDGDWFMHVDADEVHVPPPGFPTLREAFLAIDAEGFNAVNFQEFTFIPTRESPDHDHPDYLRTMRWYYPFLPAYPNGVRAWKRQAVSVDLSSTAGHRVEFPGFRLYPESFRMRHYLYLSVAHAVRKYVGRVYDPGEVASGWHGARARVRPEMFGLPGQDELRRYVADDRLDATNPRRRHYFADALAETEGAST